MTDPANQEPPAPRRALWLWLLLGVAVLFVVGVRVHLLAMPHWPLALLAAAGGVLL